MQHARLVASAAFLLLLSGGRYAQACGQAPPPYWTWTGTRPAPEGLVPLDGAILLTARSWSRNGSSVGAPSELSNVAKVSVRDASGALVPGQVAAWYSRTGPA